MKIKSLLILTLGFFISTNLLMASGHISGHRDPLNKTFIKNSKQLPDYAVQQKMRLSTSWQKFLDRNGHWNVIFDENSAMPYRAFGKPISVGGSDAQSTAMNFLNANLSEFNIPVSNLNFRSETVGTKFIYVNYKQFYQGLEVLFTNVQVKMNHDYKVNQFALECHKNISVNLQAGINSQAATQFATTGVTGVVSVNMSPDMKILPIPGNREYSFHLVYEMIVENNDGEEIPGKYYTLVDANSGEILYRSNRVNHVSANTDVTVTGTLYVTHPYNPSTVEPLRNMKIVESATTYHTDAAGYIGLTNTANTTATFSLEGLWSRVRTNNVTPSWTVNLTPGQNNVNIDASTNIRQRSAYYAVNTVHDFMKTKYPLFTGMDNPLITNVDVAGSCNAFYDGNSINFYAAGAGCNATALIADVCYHEYGHGINDKFYQSQGFNFQNGAMGEGYADIWALGITDNPILGIGFYDNDPNGYIRRYDIDKKVFPADLVGEVHADGEIIAGCFWDTYLNLGNLQQMMDLFAQSFYAGITGADGTEGALFSAVLLEVLTLDDNDGDLTNGTPNYCDITSAFAIHGINLGAAVNLQHTEVLQAAPLAPVNVNAIVQGIGAGSSLKGYYRIGNSGAWTLFPLNNTGGNNFQGVIPDQPKGTIIEYYMGIEDDCGTFTNIIPQGADALNPNIPYYILVGFDLLLTEDFDFNQGNWINGLPTDDASTGEWVVDIPMPSYVGTAEVQPGDQLTIGGSFCAVTGNASSPSAGAGENDIDGGKTTLIFTDLDLSTYTNPAISYYRWYSNDQGATPGTDFWQVAVSGDGINYVDVENIDVADHSWRRFAFKVMDYIVPTSNVRVRFIAEDANAGSLVEAAVDELMVWDEIATGVNDINSVAVFSLFPNPADNVVNLNIGLLREDKVEISVVNALGQQVYSFKNTMPSGNNLFTLDASTFPAGLYQISLITESSLKSQKFNIVR